VTAHVIATVVLDIIAPWVLPIESQGSSTKRKRQVSLSCFTFIVVMSLYWAALSIYLTVHNNTESVVLALLAVVPMTVLRAVNEALSFRVMRTVSGGNGSTHVMTCFFCSVNHASFLAVAIGFSKWNIALLVGVMDIVYSLINLPFVLGFVKEHWKQTSRKVIIKLISCKGNDDDDDDDDWLTMLTMMVDDAVECDDRGK